LGCTISTGFRDSWRSGASRWPGWELSGDIGAKCMLEENVEALGIWFAETDKLLVSSDCVGPTDDIELEGVFDVMEPKAES
jgi:kynurenine formamidase